MQKIDPNPSNQSTPIWQKLPMRSAPNGSPRLRSTRLGNQLPRQNNRRPPNVKKAVAWGYNHVVEKLNRGLLSIAPTPLLTGVALEPSGKCNLKCQMCCAKQRQKKAGFMSLDLFTSLVNELGNHQYPVRVGLGFGGEPLLHPQFPFLLDYLMRRKNLNVGVVTNGLLLKKHFDAIAKHPRLRINVSVDHKIPSVNETAMELFDQGVKISINAVATNFTTPELTNLIEFWRQRDILNVNPQITCDLTLPTQPYWTKHNQRIRKPNPFCQWSFHHLAILWDGSITLCCHDIAGNSVLGRLNQESTRPLSEFWHSPIMKLTRIESLMLKKPRREGCESCDVWKWSNKYTTTFKKRERLK